MCILIRALIIFIGEEEEEEEEEDVEEESRVLSAGHCSSLASYVS